MYYAGIWQDKQFNPPLCNNLRDRFVEFYIQHYICMYRRDIDIVYL